MTAELIAEVGRLRVENFDLSGQLARVRADLVSEVIRSEDLAEALSEAADWCEGREGADRMVVRWRLLLTTGV